MDANSGGDDRWHIQAEVRGLPTHEGGRRRAIHSDYRPAWDVGNLTEDGGRMMHSGRLVWEGGTEVVELGLTAPARIYPLVEDLWAHVEPGMTISAYEGTRRVCEALVTGTTLHPNTESG